MQSLGKDRMKALATVTAFFALVAGAAICQQPDKFGVYTRGEGITPPELVQAVAAVSPLDKDLQGVVHISALRVAIGADGAPSRIEVESVPNQPFDDAAIAAVKASKFEPGKRYGQPAPVYLSVWVPFGAMDQMPFAGDTAYRRRRMTPPRVLNNINAEFSDEARRKKIDGIVLVSATVSEQGLPVNPRVVQGVGYGLDEKALESVRQYRFHPATIDGVPVSVPITVEVSFRLYRK